MKNLQNGPKSPENRCSFIKKQSAAGTATRGAILFFALVTVAVLHTSPAIAQSYCGPLDPVNFNLIDGHGAYPSAYIAVDGQGNLYGTTNGSYYGPGTIWKYPPSGGLGTLWTFSGPVYVEVTPDYNIGASITSGVTLDSQGNFWSTTFGGGNEFQPDGGHPGYGTLYELTAAGVFTTLVEFDSTNGANPGPVVLDSHGNLWGVAGGGANGDGTLFEYSPASGQLTNPVSFTGANGSAPTGSAAFDSQGNLYGVTESGGTAGFGTLWEYSAQGVLTTLVNFTSPNGETPTAGVTLDGKGNIYGTTYQGGAGYGTIWKYSLQTGQLTTLVSFDGTNGQYPEGGVTLDANGNLYGTAANGGPDSDGLVWEYSPSAGVLTDLATFNGQNGQNPVSTLVFDALGNLWGTTNEGGSGGSGTLFELTPNTGGGCIGLSSLTLNPTSIANGGTSMGTVSLTGKAPSGGSPVGLSSNSSFITVPFSVTVPAGATSATFPVTTNGFVNSNQAVTITAALGGSTVQASLTETAGVPVKSISFKPSSVTGGASTTATVTLTAAAPPGGNQVFVEPSQAIGVVPSPPVDTVTVTVPAGKTSLSFSLGTLCTTTKVVVPTFASSGGASVSSDLTVNASSSCNISSLTLNPTSVSGGASSTGTVTLSAAAPSGGAVVTLTSGDTSVATVPASVTVAAGSTSATFTVSTTSVSTTNNVTISGTYNGTTKTALLNVTPAGPVAISSITLNPTSTVGGNASFGVVNLTAAAPSGGAVVPLTNSDPSVVTAPSSVTVAAGEINATFTVTTQSVLTSTIVTISGTYGGATESVTLTVTPAMIGSLNLNPTSVSGGSNSTGTVNLNGNAPSGGAVVSLTSSNTSVGTVPSSVTIAAGSTSATFTVSTTSVSSSTSVTISGTYAGATQSATLTVTPAPALTLSSLALNPTSVTGGSSSTGTVTLSGAAPSGGSVVSLSSNSGSASVPSTVTVAAGSTSASFTVTTTSVTTTTTAVITGTLGSSSAQASLTINPASTVTLSSVTLNPTSVSGGNNSTGTVTLTAAAPSGGAKVTLSSSNTSVATVPSSVTVAAGSTSATFTVSTQRVSQNTNVTISGTYAGANQSATLTVTSGRNH